MRVPQTSVYRRPVRGLSLTVQVERVEMIHEVLATGPLQCNCQILGDDASKAALVIDPGDDIPDIEQADAARVGPLQLFVGERG